MSWLIAVFCRQNSFRHLRWPNIGVAVGTSYSLIALICQFEYDFLVLIGYILNVYSGSQWSDSMPLPLWLTVSTIENSKTTARCVFSVSYFGWLYMTTLLAIFLTVFIHWSIRCWMLYASFLPTLLIVLEKLALKFLKVYWMWDLTWIDRNRCQREYSYNQPQL